ncbi:hypothetical protein [Mobiluncus mulieris]|uniref:hypothetical protein n=1 Tax=Mobiluncus mulieris TaxID=2052 RepID=UPI00146FF9D2|nr:hypothetical protein [Mobiluncus mulieris]NMW74273.1 hypothetical protein [Mobiluncus mulieris]
MSETPLPAPQTQPPQTTAPGDPGDPANPSQAESRFTIISVIQGIIAVFVVAMLVWMWPRPATTNAKHSLDLSTDPNMAIVPEAEPAPIPIAGVTSVSGIKDGWDHPELAGLAADGKPETSWRTASMRDATLVGGRGYGLVINLGETPVRVRKVVVTSSAHGGQLELRQPADGQPADSQPAGGTLLGALPLSNTTAFNLDTPVLTKQLVLWSTNLPTAPGGGFRLMISEVQVLG